MSAEVTLFVKDLKQLNRCPGGGGVLLRILCRNLKFHQKKLLAGNTKTEYITKQNIFEKEETGTNIGG